MNSQYPEDAGLQFMQRGQYEKATEYFNAALAIEELPKVRAY